MSSANSGYAAPVFRSIASLVARIGSVRSGRAEHEVDLTGEGELAARELGAHAELADRRELAAELLERRERAPEQLDPAHHLHQDLVLVGTAELAPVLAEAFFPLDHAIGRHGRRRPRPRGGRGCRPRPRSPCAGAPRRRTSTECEKGGASPWIFARNDPSQRSWSVRWAFPSQSGSRNSRPRTASSIRSRSRCGRSAENEGRGSVPINWSSVRRWGPVSSMGAC